MNFIPTVKNRMSRFPHFAHLATLRKNGAPQVDPVWVGREGDRILVGTGEGTVKAKNSRRDPRVEIFRYGR